MCTHDIHVKQRIHITVKLVRQIDLKCTETYPVIAICQLVVAFPFGKQDQVCATPFLYHYYTTNSSYLYYGRAEERVSI